MICQNYISTLCANQAIPNNIVIDIRLSLIINTIKAVWLNSDGADTQANYESDLQHDDSNSRTA